MGHPQNVTVRPQQHGAHALLVQPGEVDLAGRQAFDFAYDTSGLGWRAEYQADVSGQGGDCRMAFEGAAMVANRSGVDYRGVALTLVAGQPNRVSGGGLPAPMAAKSARAEMMVADAVPAFGIVVAVMGVVNVMGSVGQPPAVLGKMIGGALVGTFLGILVSYGFVAPIASQLEQKVEESGKIYQVIKVVLLASMNGYAPQVAVEFGRKVLYSTDRPGFSELEQEIKSRKG